MSVFEKKYLVLKHSDIHNYLTVSERNILSILASKVGKSSNKDFLIVEDDWSIYNEVYKLVEKEWWFKQGTQLC